MKIKNKTTQVLIKPLIIIGFGRSGSSIISDIILKNNDLALVSNFRSKYPKNKYIDLIRLVFDNKFYSLRGQKEQLNKVSLLNRFIFKNSESYPFHNYITKVNFGKRFLNKLELTEKQITEIRKGYFNLTKFQFKKRLGFKITGPSRLKYLNQIFPDARYIYVIREPLPNIRSFIKVGFNQDRIHDLWWEGDEIYTKEEIDFVQQNSSQPEYIAALQYFKIHQNHLLEAEFLGIQNKIFTIKYEEFVTNPELKIQEMLNFAELKVDKNIKDFLSKNKIYNQNNNTDFYFSDGLDKKVLDISLNGI